MSLLTVYTTLHGVPVGDGPILSALSGTVVMEALGQFPMHSLVFPGGDRRALLALQPYTLLEIVQEDVGTIGYGYVLDPRQQVTQNDDHTVTLDLQPVAIELTWRLTGRNWQAANTKSIVYRRLGTLQAGWTATYLDAGMFGVDGAALDITIGVTLANPTILGAILDTAKQFADFVRMAVASDRSPGDPLTHVPVRALEIGQFGAAPTVWLTGPNGGNLDDLATNDLIKIPATIDYEPNTVVDLVNVCTPFGAGSSSDTLVTLERLWRILNDPLYLNYGRWGTDAQSIAHWGGDTTKTSLFPEYDPAYPISDPENPPTGVTQWAITDTAGNPVVGAYAVTVGATIGGRFIAGARLPDGSAEAVVTDTTGRPMPFTAYAQYGALGTRTFTTAGDLDFPVYDAVSYAANGFHEGALVDSSLAYADNSVANQELTARALYMETVTNFKRFAHAHTTFTATTPGTGRPTRAGDLIAIDVQRLSVDDVGAVVELNVVENLRVMSVVRTFSGASGGSETPPMDTYTLSNLGRFDQDDASAAAGQAQQLIALQLTQGTSLAPYPLVFAGNADALHPLIVWVLVPKQLYRWQQFRVRVDFLPYTATSITAENQNGTPVVSADVEVLLPTPNALNTQSAPIANMPPHIHQMRVFAGGTHGIPTASSKWVNLDIFGSKNPTALSAYNINDDTNIYTETEILRPDLAPTAHPHLIAAAGATIAHIPAGQRIANLPKHTHPLDQRIPDGPTAPNVSVLMDGQSLSSGLTLTSGMRSADGTFPGSFALDDLSEAANRIQGDFAFTFTPGTGAGNPYGVGRFQITIVGMGEWGGLTSTVRAS